MFNRLQWIKETFGKCWVVSIGILKCEDLKGLASYVFFLMESCIKSCTMLNKTETSITDMKLPKSTIDFIGDA